MFNLNLFAHSATGLLPVLVFLIGLIFIDSYKLVRFRAVLRSLLVGGFVAVVCFLINSGLLATLDIELQTFSRYLAPLIEEGFKALFLVYLIRSDRVGFLVDAAIHGFAIGAGFAFVENIYYLQALTESSLWTWMVRGFGTAIMHGGTMALMGIVTKTLYDGTGSHGPRTVLPGLALAYVLHALFNHFILPPLFTTVLLVLTFPVLIALVFYRSEQATQEWLGRGFDIDQELLELLGSSDLSDTRIGRYLYALKRKFPGEVIVDMLCLLRLHVELSIRAKGVLMMQEAGFRVPPDPEVKAKFAELAYLKESIGTTGLLALAPFLHTSSRDLWQLNMLNQA